MTTENFDTKEPWVDPVVAEVRAAREALLVEVDYDLHKLCEMLRAHQTQAGRRVTSRGPRRITYVSGEAA